jgi:hypothetical protein
METSRLSSKGQVIIPVGDGILLKPKKAFSETKLEEVAGCLKYSGKPKSLDELEDAIRLGIMEQRHDCG